MIFRGQQNRPFVSSSKYLPVKIPGVTSGRNSMAAVYKSGLTKIANKTALKMSAKVVAKGFVSEFTGGYLVIVGTKILESAKN